MWQPSKFIEVVARNVAQVESDSISAIVHAKISKDTMLLNRCAQNCAQCCFMCPAFYTSNKINISVRTILSLFKFDAAQRVLMKVNVY